MEPISLTIENFYAIAHGKIDFVKFSSAIILGNYENNVLKSNGTGKTSVLESISWVLFNKTRQSKVDDIIRWTTNNVMVEFEFNFNNHTYKIIRKRSRVSNKASVSLLTKNGDKWINDSGSTDTETDKKILGLLKIDYGIFSNSVYFKQHDISIFADSSPSTRKDIIKSLMKLSHWDDYQKQAKTKLTIVKDKLERLMLTINDSNGLDILYNENIDKISTINDELEHLLKVQRNTNDHLRSLLEVRKEINIDNLLKLMDLAVKKNVEIKANGKKLQHKSTEIDNELAELQYNTEQYNKDINSIQEQLKKTQEVILNLKAQNNEYRSLEERLFNKTIEKSKLESSINDLEESTIDVGQCQLCLTEITPTTLPHIHENRALLKNKLKDNLECIINEINTIKNEYMIKKNNADTLAMLIIEEDNKQRALGIMQEQQNILNAKILTLQEENVIINTSLRNAVDELNVNKIEIEALNKKIDEQKANNIDDEISTYEQKMQQLTDAVNAKNMELGALTKEKEIVEQKLAITKKAAEHVIELNKEKTIYEQLIRFFGKEGIQAVFIESIVDELEQYANMTLSHICNEPTIIKFKTQKKSGDAWQETLDIDVIMNGFPQTFESLGGGERFRISLAIRIGLSEVLVKRVGGEIRLLLLDEIDSPLDTYGLNNLFENIIKGLEKRFKILVISHHGQIADRFTNTINVIKTNNGSYLSQI